MHCLPRPAHMTGMSALPVPRQPAGQPSGGEFSARERRSSGLSLVLPFDTYGKIPEDEAALLGDIDLDYHPADIAWAEADAEVEQHMKDEDPFFDPDGPWSVSTRDVA